MAYDVMLAFDVDGVLANFSRGFTRIGNELFGTPIGDIPCQRTWMFEDYPALGLTKPMCDDIWRVIKSSPSFWADLDPTNISVMGHLNSIRNKMFITNRMGQDPEKQTVAFLERWGVQNPFVVVAANKGEVAKQYNVRGFLDDLQTNVYDVSTMVPECYAALLDIPYNQMHHFLWSSKYRGDVVLSVDHFITECNKRQLIQYK